MNSVQNEIDELEAAIEMSHIPAPETPACEEATKASADRGKRYHPSQVPYINDAYTYADRISELELLKNLLDFKRSAVQAELSAVLEIAKTREYPNIAFQE